MFHNLCDVIFFNVRAREHLKAGSTSYGDHRAKAGALVSGVVCERGKVRA
jgi:hypothetical protein